MRVDLATTPTSGIRVQLCGDGHVGNFGAFASPERRVLFDITDFDETIPGPWEFNVNRLGSDQNMYLGTNELLQSHPRFHRLQLFFEALFSP